MPTEGCPISPPRPTVTAALVSPRLISVVRVPTHRRAGGPCGGSHPCPASKHREGYAPMLVLSRKKNESIVINNDITVTVVEIRGDKVRLGIVAPKEVPVHRQEVYDAIHGK